MFNLLMSKKTMKKIWSLMLVALVMLGAAACTETDVNDNVEQKAGLSFYAEIANDSTRAYIEKSDDTWKTTWEKDDVLKVDTFSFVYDGEKFTCTEDGVNSLVGKTVTITGKYGDSCSGKKALSIKDKEVTFAANMNVALESNLSFFHFTTNSTSEVELTLSEALFLDGEADTTFWAEATGEQFVAFYPTGNEVTLSYSINGVKCKEVSKAFTTGMVYNLGTLDGPKVYLSTGVWDVDDAWFAAHFFNSADGYADVKLTKVSEGLYSCDVPADMEDVAFCRMNPEFTEFSWDEGHVWNQTANLTIGVAPYNYYYIFGWDLGVWATKSGLYNVGLVGLKNNWDDDHYFTKDGDFFTLKNVTIADTDEFKLRINGNWDMSFGMAGEDTTNINKDTKYELVQNGHNMMVVAGTYDIYFSFVTKEFYVLTQGKTPADIVIPQYKVYVYNFNTDWSDFYLYVWDENETTFLGGWPGATTTETETINGYEYMVWTLPIDATGKSVTAILNNNNGAQTANYPLGVIDSDMYILLNNGSADAIENINNPEPVIPTETHKIYVYQHNSSWDKLNLYTWNSENNTKYTGAWPGSTTATTEVINGYTYYVWEMPAAATGRDIMLILNNGSAQTGNNGPYTLDKDLYIRLNNTTVQEIEDSSNPEPTIELQARKIYATTTLSWSNMNIYAWGGLSFDWPGVAMKKDTINGTPYYVYTFDESYDGATINVIFNNGSAQTVDINNVKLDKDRFFKVLTTTTDSKYNYQELVDPR